MTSQTWHDSAPFWARHHATLAAMLAPITDAMIQASGMSAEDRVLDVAGGSGEPSLTLAGRAAAVVHTDAVPGMVENARRLASARRLVNFSSQPAVAESLPFSDDTFDRVFCRLGLMFFADPVGAVGEMLRVARRGEGPRSAFPVCVATWDARSRNPFFDVPLTALDRVAPQPPTSDALRFEDPAAVEEVFLRAGAREAHGRRIPFQMTGSLDLDAWWRFRVEMSATLREWMPRLSEEERATVGGVVRDGMRPWFDPGGFSIPASVIVTVGR
jgi:SAM-dependent methyltransferase